MDAAAPASLLSNLAEVKQYKSSLKVYASVGGWSFSDNHTATQPLFGEIAASPAKRQTFANNVMRFLDTYGFDGLDIDWEYPGAPDRGGSDVDTKNYVFLLQALRSTFDKSTRSLGLTFTAPTSYWYLRWFDLKNMMKYADWINLMTYDLHGIWDRNDGIGNIVQAHTNLTEIKIAVELLWRNNIAPAHVVMGFGFYGRSFEIQDQACNTPGCAFTGGGSAGPCSASSGILGYYEIMALLEQHPRLKPIYDEDAAVKYLSYNTDQWISYDDLTTLQQKVAWANTTGLGGAMIWASDLDDSKYTAHSGLVGKPLSYVDTTAVSSKDKAIVDAYSIAENLVGQNGQNCLKMSSCTDQDNTMASRCPTGYKKLGWEKGGCGKDHAHSICCPSASAPTNCIWRGSGGDCNGQCHVGEAHVLSSSRGGFPTESNDNKCSRGYKVFCCNAGDWSYVTSGCRWTGCGGSCNSGEDEVSTMYDSNSCTIFSPNKKYCCPSTAMLYDCHWIGSQPDCQDAKCASDEVAVALNAQGKDYSSCSWGRKKTDCCKVRKEPPPTLTCTVDICDYMGNACSLSDDDAFGSVNSKRASESHNISSQDVETLEKRGGRRDFPFNLLGTLPKELVAQSRSYPSRSQLFNTPLARRIVLRQNFNITYRRCDDTTVQGTDVDLEDLPENAETEHLIDLSVHNRFAEAANRGRLPSGIAMRAPALSTDFFRNTYLANNVLSPSLPRVAGTSPDIRSPFDRVYEAMGSTTNRVNLVLTDRSLNAVKGSLFILKEPMKLSVFTPALKRAVDGDPAETEALIEILRTTIGVFNYLQLEPIATRMDAVRSLMRDQFQTIESSVDGATGLTSMWDEFFPDYMTQVENFAQTWVTNRISQIREAYGAAETTPRNAASVLTTLLVLEQKVKGMTIPQSGSSGGSDDVQA